MMIRGERYHECNSHRTCSPGQPSFAQGLHSHHNRQPMLIVSRARALLRSHGNPRIEAVFASLIGLTFRLPCLVRAHARLPARDRLALNIKVVSTKNKNMTVVCRGGNAEAQSTLRGCPNSSCLADLSCFCCKEAPPSCPRESRNQISSEPSSLGAFGATLTSSR